MFCLCARLLHTDSCQTCHVAARYENGKYLHKRNTFTDYIACAEHLIANKWTSPARCCSAPSCPHLIQDTPITARSDVW